MCGLVCIVILANLTVNNMVRSGGGMENLCKRVAPCNSMRMCIHSGAGNINRKIDTHEFHFCGGIDTHIRIHSSSIQCVVNRSSFMRSRKQISTVKVNCFHCGTKSSDWKPKGMAQVIKPHTHKNRRKNVCVCRKWEKRAVTTYANIKRKNRPTNEWKNGIKSLVLSKTLILIQLGMLI